MKIILAFIFSFLIFSDATAQADSSRTAQVYFMRNNQVVDFKLNKVFMDGIFLCKIGEHKYFIRDVPAGKHWFSAQFNGKKSKKKAEKLWIEIEAGKNYYIELIFQDKWPIPNLYCIEVAESSAKRILPTLKLSDRCNEEN